MDLERLLVELVNEHGLTEDEALKVAAARIRAHRKTAIQRKQSGSVVSVQDDGRGVDYGDETPEQAKQRWMEQERRDPQGVYSEGGSSLSGIFGEGSIPLDDYDPAAVNRTIGAVAQVKQLQVQQEMLRELQAVRNERLEASHRKDRELASREERQLESNRRRFGKKRR